MRTWDRDGRGRRWRRGGGSVSGFLVVAAALAAFVAAAAPTFASLLDDTCKDSMLVESPLSVSLTGGPEELHLDKRQQTFGFYFNVPKGGEVYKVTDVFRFDITNDLQPPPDRYSMELRSGQSSTRVLTLADNAVFFGRLFNFTLSNVTGIDAFRTGFYSVFATAINSQGQRATGQSRNFIIIGQGELPAPDNFTFVSPNIGYFWPSNTTHTVIWEPPAGTVVFPSTYTIYLFDHTGTVNLTEKMGLAPVMKGVGPFTDNSTGVVRNATSWTVPANLTAGRYTMVMRCDNLDNPDDPNKPFRGASRVFSIGPPIDQVWQDYGYKKALSFETSAAERAAAAAGWAGWAMAAVALAVALCL